jgi:hypothetical protein
MSNYRDRVPCFCRFTGWRSRLSRSNLVAVAVATLHLAKVNYFGPLPLHQFLRRKRRQFSMRRATLSGQLRSTSMSRVLAFKVKRVSRATLSGATFYGFRAAFQANQERRHFRAQLAQSARKHFEQVWCRHFETAGGQFKCWHFTNRHLKGISTCHMSCVLSCVRCYVMPHASCVLCHMYVCCHVGYVLCGICHETCVMCHVSCYSLCRHRVPYVMVYVSCFVQCVYVMCPHVMFHLSC